jgi:hypothetical protein
MQPIISPTKSAPETARINKLLILLKYVSPELHRQT